MALLFGGFTAIVAAVTTGNQPVGRQRAQLLRNSASARAAATAMGHSASCGTGVPVTGFSISNVRKRALADNLLWTAQRRGARAQLTGTARNRRIAVIGLGTGTLAAWGRAGDTFRFYEINPDVDAIAHRWFSFLKDSKARTEIVLGDARVRTGARAGGGQVRTFRRDRRRRFLERRDSVPPADQPSAPTSTGAVSRPDGTAAAAHFESCA